MLKANIITTYGHHNTKSVIVKGPHSPSKTHSLRSGSLASNHRIPGNLLLSTAGLFHRSLTPAWPWHNIAPHWNPPPAIKEDA